MSEITFAPDFKITEQNKRAYLFAKAWAMKPKGFLYLSGTVGIGKTMLARAIKNYIDDVYNFLPQCIEDKETGQRLSRYKRSVVFITTMDFARKVMEEISDPTKVRGSYIYFIRKVDILILDDLGAEHKTDFKGSELFDLINYRYTNELPTVFTSNYQIDSLKSIYGFTGERIADRIREYALICHTEGESFRRKKQIERQKAIEKQLTKII